MPRTVIEDRQPVYTYLPGHLRDRLDAAAAQIGLSRAAWVRMTLLAAIEQHTAGGDA